MLSKHTDIPIAICHLEETKKRGLLGLVSYKLQRNLTRRDLIDEAQMGEEVDQALIELTEKKASTSLLSGWTKIQWRY